MFKSLKKIHIDNLRPGMYVEDVLNECGVLLFSADTLITTTEQIDRLKNQGVADLYINKDKSIDDIINDELLPGPEYTQPEVFVREVESPKLIKWSDYREELKKAQRIREETIDSVRDAMDAARMGRMFTLTSISRVTERMIEGVIADSDVYMCLCQLKSHDYQTYNHSINVAILMTALANALGYTDDQLFEIALGGILHDIGKMRIAEEILRKDGKYTRLEYELMKQHPSMGIEVVRKNHSVPEVTKKIIGQHHERWNGSGYPTGLKGERIDPSAMICGLADVYDSLTTESAFRVACLPQEALALIFQGSDEDYPRRLVEHFTKLLGIYPVGSFIKLDSGEMGIVIKINRQSLLNPTILVLFNEQGSRLDNPLVRDLSAPTIESDRVLWKVECSLDPSAYHIEPRQFFQSK